MYPILLSIYAFNTFLLKMAYLCLNDEKDIEKMKKSLLRTKTVGRKILMGNRSHFVIAIPIDITRLRVDASGNCAPSPTRSTLVRSGISIG